MNPRSSSSRTGTACGLVGSPWVHLRQLFQRVLDVPLSSSCVVWQPLLALAGETRPPVELPVLLPYNSLEKQYFRFGEPIPTAQYDGQVRG